MENKSSEDWDDSPTERSTAADFPKESDNYFLKHALQENFDVDVDVDIEEDILGEENGAQEFDALLEQHADAEEEEPPPSLLDENSEEHRLVARVRTESVFWLWIYLPSLVLLVYLLVKNEPSSCESNLLPWARMQAVMELSICILAVAMYISTIFLDIEDNTAIGERRIKALHSIFLSSKLLIVGMELWCVYGAYLDLTGQLTTCQKSSFLYLLSYYIIVVHCLFFFIQTLSLCCGVSCFFLCRFIHRRNYLGKVLNAADDAMIEKYCKQAVNSGALLPSDDTGDCIICLQQYELDEHLLFLPCNHYFHEECIRSWLKEKKSCPLCNRDIDAEDPRAKIMLETEGAVEMDFLEAVEEGRGDVGQDQEEEEEEEEECEVIPSFQVAGEEEEADNLV